MESLGTVVIVGRPNVGKSTLFNRLIGRRKALVHDQPGLTRDRNVALVVREDHPIQIVDTGGILGESEDLLATLVEEQVNLAVAGGDRVLLMVDAKEGLLPLDREIALRLRKAGKATALVVNKVDVPGHLPRGMEFHELGMDQIFFVSAEHGLGLDEVWDYILEGMPAPVEPPAAAPGEAIRVAIVGKPNAGKSSILNRILGEERALVSEIPGTTRDPVDVPLSLDGQDFLLVDTAGIRRKSRNAQAAEVLSVILARRSLEQCHVALLILDASGMPTHQDAHIAGLIEASLRGALVVLNKWDLVGDPERAKELEETVAERFSFIGWMPTVRTSARTNRHVDRLLPAVARVYRNFSQQFPTATLNKNLEKIVRAVSPPSVGGKDLKIRYATQTGSAPPILTLFTNSRFPPPDSYHRYLKNRIRECYDLEGSPLVLKYRKE